MNVQTFEKMAAQGDLLIRKIDKLPTENLKAVEPEDGKLILAHSETGHHHSIMLEKEMGLSRNGRAKIDYFQSNDPMLCYLVVDGDYADVVHERDFDTHQPIRITGGTYELRRQKEATPEGWRRVAD